ncbi:MAG TPA: ABC transporter permease [Planctomycetaceae bacterium]|jgi:putative ABC transport system permease protein|nr:ABC transporter permease [Planctomycetaceae bacterium]
MNLFSIAWKSIRQRFLSSSLTAFSVALGVMLMVAVLVIYGIMDHMFSQQTIAYQLIYGPKGSDLQLVLNTVYRVSAPLQNLPYLYYEELKKDSKVELAVPFCLGDTTQKGSFPIVGTTEEYFEHPYTPGQMFQIRGEPFASSFDAIIGSEVARTNEWDIGTQFQLIHGGAESHKHEEKFTVKAVLAPTGTPNDKTVFIHLNGFYAISGHDAPLKEAVKRWHEFSGKGTSDSEINAAAAEWAQKCGIPIEEPPHKPGEHHHHHKTCDVQKEVTAILVNMKSVSLAAMANGELKRGYKVQAVNPIVPMQQLMSSILGNVRTALVVLTSLIIIVSGVGIFVSIYNSMSDRRREIAIMRALGAQRRTVFAIILAESILLCFGGGILGILLGHGLVFAAAPVVQQQTGLLINPFAFEQIEFVLLPALIALASLIGIVPGLSAYRTDVARALAD